jgi:mannose-6-phosphate isomerase
VSRSSVDRGIGSRTDAVYRGTVSDDSIRPWGHYHVLSDGDGYKTKSITVKPGKRLSYQKHARRSEHWFVVRGEGSVVLDGTSTDVRAGSAVDVPVGVAHRIANTGDEDLVFVEVQHGEYFGEDDIVRIEDDFGRSA